MAQLVTLMIASRGCSISGSGTVSHRMSCLPCQTSAFINISLRRPTNTKPRGFGRVRGEYLFGSLTFPRTW